MKILAEKYGGLFDNKFLMVSVLVAIFTLFSMLVYAELQPSDLTLRLPENGSVDFNGGNQLFNCTVDGVVSGSTTGNVSFWHNFTGTWQRNQTKSWSGVGVSNFNVSFNLTLDTVNDMSGSWSCRANQSGGIGFNFSGQGNFSFNLDNTAPTAPRMSNSSNLTTNGSVITNTNFIAFNWTATTEAYFINYTLKIYNSSEIVDANFYATNVTTAILTTSINGSPASGGTFADGKYHYLVDAYENGTGGRHTNSTINSFVVDTGHTNATLNFPVNNTWRNGHVTFNYTIQDANPQSCMIQFTNSSSKYVGNQTNSSAQLATSTQVFSFPEVDFKNASGLGARNYTWFVNCTDDGGNQGNSSIFSFAVDITAPSLTIAGGVLANNTFTNSTYIFVNVSTNDTYFQNVTFSLFNSSGAKVVEIVNQTTFTAANNSRNHNFTVSADGLYFWNVTSRDIAGNENTTVSRYVTVDTTFPTVLFGPLTLANNSFVQADHIAMNATYVDVNFSNITFYVYNKSTGLLVRNISNGTKSKNYNNSANFTSLGSGTYLINITVKDKAGNVNSTNTRNITLDLIGPTKPTLGNVLQGTSYFGNGTITSDATPTLNWTLVTEAHSFSHYNVTIYNDSNGLTAEANRTRTFVLNRTVNTNVTVGTALVGNTSYFWRVTAYDQALFSNVSETFNFTVDTTPPIVVALAPLNETRTNASEARVLTSATVLWKYNLTETHPGECSVYGNFSGTYQKNVTNSSLATDSNEQFFLGPVDLKNGSYIWNIYCNDSSTPGNVMSANETTNFTFIVDTSTPTIINLTANASSFTDRKVSFQVSGNGDTVINQSSITVSPDNATFSNFNATNNCVAHNVSTYNCTYIETGLIAGKLNNLVITARNNATTLGRYSLGVTPSAASNYTKSLVSGWNLIATPLILENSTINNVVANGTHIRSIYSFDGSSFTSWQRNLTDTLTTMEPLKGYWVYTEGVTNIHFFGNTTTGNPQQPFGIGSPRSLSASTWYLIGNYGTFADNRKTDDALNDLCGNSGSVCSAGGANFDSLLWYDTAKTLLNSTDQSTWSSDKIHDRGQGFWIYMNAADTLIDT